MTHSPSPWRRAGENSGHIWAPDGDGVVQVAIVGAYSFRDMLSFNRERWDADARLISAAPEILEALDEVLTQYVLGLAELPYWNGDPEKEAIVIRARAVISKARGTP